MNSTLVYAQGISAAVSIGFAAGLAHLHKRSPTLAARLAWDWGLWIVIGLGWPSVVAWLGRMFFGAS